MALPASGQIGFGQIITEFKGTNNQTENEISDYYSGAGLVTSTTGPNVPTSGEIRWSDFYNASNVSGSANTSWSMNWDLQNSVSATSGYAEAFGWVQFSREDTNNRVKINWADGTSTTQATVYTGYVAYSNLGTITSIEAQYNVSSQYCDSNCATMGSNGIPNDGSYTPTLFGYSSGTYYTVPSSGGLRFAWLAQSNPNQNLTGGIGGAFPMVIGGDPHFRIKIVSSAGTFYSVCSVTATNISLSASNGSTNTGGFGGGSFGGI
jgi:hypothetical protein